MSRILVQPQPDGWGYPTIIARDATLAVIVNTHTENQSWIVHRGGQVVEKRAQTGPSSLSDLERLIYCLWVTDYMMRNAGDFANAEDMYPEFQSDAKQLGLARTQEAFSLSQRILRREYFERFETICDEIRNADS